MLVMPYLFCSQRSGERTPRSGSVDKPVMGAFCAGSYEVTPPRPFACNDAFRRATDRPKDSNPCVRLTKSQTRRKTSAISSLAYEAARGGFDQAMRHIKSCARGHQGLAGLQGL